MTDQVQQNGLLTVLAGVILMLVLGSIHAFSVFLVPLELRFGASRREVNITCSLALVIRRLWTVVFVEFRPRTPMPVPDSPSIVKLFPMRHRYAAQRRCPAQKLC
ncbi:MAG: OFA family MFS transporter [Hyphomicrobiales bacterium]|nr:OFA family MFS transporter [Hyphomicrobiales bacterium]MCP4997773.1 OFA family MFS transporter [Hyphomicrobiales bacterium]